MVDRNRLVAWLRWATATMCCVVNLLVVCNRSWNNYMRQPTEEVEAVSMPLWFLSLWLVCTNCLWDPKNVVLLDARIGTGPMMIDPTTFDGKIVLWHDLMGSGQQIPRRHDDSVL